MRVVQLDDQVHQLLMLAFPIAPASGHLCGERKCSSTGVLVIQLDLEVLGGAQTGVIVHRIIFFSGRSSLLACSLVSPNSGIDWCRQAE